MSEWGRMGPQLPDEKRLEILEEHESDIREAAARDHVAREAVRANGPRRGLVRRFLDRVAGR